MKSCRKLYVSNVRHKINKWFYRFKNAFEAHKSTNQTTNSAIFASTSNSESHASSSSQHQVQNEPLDDECLLPALADISANVQNENNNNKQNTSNNQSPSNRDLLQETNVCEVTKSEIKSNWYKFKWTNLEAIDKREFLF